MKLTIELTDRQAALLWSQYNTQPPTDTHLAWAATNCLWGTLEKAAIFTPASTAITQFAEARALLHPPTEISEPQGGGARPSGHDPT